MTKRLSVIFSEIIKCDTFADVGCDHGLIAKKVLEESLCNKLVISDISAKSLKKAETLLSDYDNKLWSSVVSDGLNNYTEKCDQVLIAGMGGEEIVHILKNSFFKPERLVLQPMKNSEKVRKFLIENGYRILKDYLFYDVKYYYIMVAEIGRDNYSEDEIIFGRDNLKYKNEDFKRFILNEIKKTKLIIQNNKENLLSLNLRLNKLEKIYEIIRNI